MADEKKIPYDAGNSEHVVKRTERVKSQRVVELGDVRAVLATDSGRRLLNRILAMTGLYHDCFAQNALVMSNLSGMRKVGLMLLAEIQTADPKAYIRMQTEALTLEDFND